MTTSKDIIGIVKELQWNHEDLTNNPGPDAQIDAEARTYTANEIIRHFPAIADALLIAVEALEHYAEEDRTSRERRLARAGVVGYEDKPGIAETALSRIHSLP